MLSPWAIDGDLRSALLGVGANDRVASDRVGRMLADLMDAGASWVRYGSGALMLAWVAAGRLGGRVRPFPDGPGLTRPAPVMGAAEGAFDELARICAFGTAPDW